MGRQQFVHGFAHLSKQPDEFIVACVLLITGVEPLEKQVFSTLKSTSPFRLFFFFLFFSFLFSLFISSSSIHRGFFRSAKPNIIKSFVRANSQPVYIEPKTGY